MSTSGQDNRGAGYLDRRSNHPQFSDMTVGDYASGMPNIRIGKMIQSLMAQLLWLIPLVIIGGVVAFIATSGVKREYQGEGRLLVQLGDEYVYQSVTGQTSQGLMVTPDIITLSEKAIMKNSDVIDTVIGQMVAKFGESRFAKDAFDKINAAERSGDPAKVGLAKVELREAVEDSFIVAPQPKSYIVDLSYKHEDGEIAVATLNAFIDAYLEYRRTIFVEGSADPISERLIAAEKQLSETERNIQAFLSSNGVADYDSERIGASNRAETLRNELTTLLGQLSETEAALASVETQLRATPDVINLYVDDRATQRVAQAELELKTLLARYLPGSDPVRAKQAEISELKSLQAANAGGAIGGRRVGPNPVYQELQTRRNLLASTADSLREKEFSLQRQLDTTDRKVRKLSRIGPQYQALLRERTALDQRLSGYTMKEQNALVSQQEGITDSENVRVISYAKLPKKGRNMRLILTAVITFGWGIFLSMVALLRVFLNPNLYTKPPSHYRRRTVDANSGQQAPYMPEHYIPESVPPGQPHQTPAAATAAPHSQAQPQQYGTSHYQPTEYSAPNARAQGSGLSVLGTVPSSEQG